MDKASAYAAATATTANSAVADSILPGDDCYYRCSQDSLCSYDPSTLTCTRDDEYKKCLEEKCLNPDPTPVDPICAWKTSCNCLADTINNCGWCQVKAYTEPDSTGTATEPYTWGYCSTQSGTNLCSASYSSGGKEGSFCTTAPTECTDDSSVDPTIKDTSSYFSDDQFKESFSKINTGKLTEADVQKVIDTYKAEGCDFTINRILKADVTTDQKGTVSTIVEVHNCDKTLEEICGFVLKGYSTTLGIPETCFKDCKFTPYSESATTVKRAVNSVSGSYIQTATVDPSTTQNSAGTLNLAPIWMILFAIFLFFRM
jgi:hypothetical protein